MEEAKLKTSLMRILDKSSDEIDDLIVTMDFKDLVKIGKAVRNNDEEEVVNISHGYSL